MIRFSCLRRFAASSPIAAVVVMMATKGVAQITGTAKLIGEVPKPVAIDMSGMADCQAMHSDPVYEPTVIVGEHNELANVVVTLSTAGGKLPPGDVPKAAAVLDQKGCEYTPHILTVRVGQPIEVRNDDPFMHNVHSLAETNADFNIVQANKNPGQKIDAPTAAETFRIKCDVHPWMSAYVIVTDHPFVAVSDEKGQLKFETAPPDGEYTATAWHEKFGTQTAKVAVKGGKASVDFSFKVETSRADEPAIGTRTLVAVASCCR